ncbi:hypothetical protein WJX82_009694 [Trebouxia sp. C0006]
MRCFGGSGQPRQNRCAATGFCKKTLIASRAGCLRLSVPFKRLVRPFRGCFGAPNSDAEPVSQVYNQAPRSSKAAPVAVLVPEYEGPISNPFASSQQTDLGGVVFVDCHATIGSQSAVHASTADIVPSEAGMAPDISSSDQLDTALTALDRVAQPPSLQSSASVDMSPLALVDQVVDDLLDEVAAPLQTVQSSIPADISGMISPRVVGAMGRGRGRVCYLDRSTFQEMAQALPTEPSSQVCWMKGKIADLGCGPAHLTTLTCLPPPSSALPTVLRLSTVGSHHFLHYSCAAMQQAWGKSSCMANGYRGPSLATLVQHGKAILKPRAHVHRQGVLLRGLTPDHVLLYSKGGQEAECGVRAASKPAAIKHHVKLAGFGADARLTGQGRAIQPSPYRCEEGYGPPEAHQGSPLTTAADVYQFGTTGSKPRAVLRYAKTAVSVSGPYAGAPLLMSTDNAEQQSRPIEAGHLISPSRMPWVYTMCVASHDNGGLT